MKFIALQKEVHNRDGLEIYENPLIECMVMVLMGHLAKQT